ncbi:hypothetical protein SDC9_67639 [bioreactor metagenome]|uniref:Uncharacterized protein n=1 Tax=bioreactor metagenome TaxID=1076179 RepID=A0A644XY58_9ZZZZ
MVAAELVMHGVVGGVIVVSAATAAIFVGDDDHVALAVRRDGDIGCAAGIVSAGTVGVEPAAVFQVSAHKSLVQRSAVRSASADVFAQRLAGVAVHIVDGKVVAISGIVQLNGNSLVGAQRPTGINSLNAVGNQGVLTIGAVGGGAFAAYVVGISLRIHVRGGFQFFNLVPAHAVHQPVLHGDRCRTERCVVVGDIGDGTFIIYGSCDGIAGQRGVDWPVDGAEQLIAAGGGDGIGGEGVVHIQGLAAVVGSKLGADRSRTAWVVVIHVVYVQGSGIAGKVNIDSHVAAADRAAGEAAGA